MNLFKQTLQRIVLTVNRLPFGLRLMRLPYYIAMRATAGLLKKYPLIMAAYARNSIALGVWVPGRSDIDLTLILRTGETPRHELDTVNGFQEGYAALQRWFPMLGEIEILNEAHLEAWTRFTVTGYEARSWLLIYGTDMDRSGYAGDRDQLACDRLNHAISIYYHQMIPAIESASEDVLARYAKKILRYLDTPAEEYGERRLAAMTREELQVMVVQALDRKVRERAAQSPDTAALDLEYTLGKAVYPEVQQGRPLAMLTGDTAAGKLLEAVLQAPGEADRAYYILGEDLGQEALLQCIGVVNSGQGTAVIMTHAVFIYFLQSVNPMEHLVLLQNRQLLWGSDPLEQAGPWPERIFHQAVCAYAIHTLPFPYFPDLQRHGTDTFRELLLGWFLRTACYFDDRVMEFDYEQMLERWQRKHPEPAIANWQARPNDPLHRFTLLRYLTDCISGALLQESEAGNHPCAKTENNQKSGAL